MYIVLYFIFIVADMGGNFPYPVALNSVYNFWMNDYTCQSNANQGNNFLNCTLDNQSLQNTPGKIKLIIIYVYRDANNFMFFFSRFLSKYNGVILFPGDNYKVKDNQIVQYIYLSYLYSFFLLVYHLMSRLDYYQLQLHHYHP